MATDPAASEEARLGLDAQPAVCGTPVSSAVYPDFTSSTRPFQERREVSNSGMFIGTHARLQQGSARQSWH